MEADPKVQVIAQVSKGENRFSMPNGLSVK